MYDKLLVVEQDIDRKGDSVNDKSVQGSKKQLA